MAFCSRVLAILVEEERWLDAGIEEMAGCVDLLLKFRHHF
jgi:hypothetical protein